MAKEESKNTKKSASSSSRKSTSGGKTTNKKTTKSSSSSKRKKTTNTSPTAGDVVVGAVKAASKSKSTAFRVIVLLLVIAIVALCVYGYFAGWFDAILHPTPSTPNDFNSQTYNVEVIKGEDLSIHFLETGNWNTGDCIYIKAGENDILIDAGSVESSAETISKYVNQYCTDGKFEYVIATHAHKDHIAGFVGTNKVQGIFERYKCDNIIQFAKTDSTTKLYNNYVAAVNKQKDDGANVYTALQCWNNKDGAQRKYDLGSGVTMEVLYQKYYEEKASTENDYSVCMLFSQGNNHYLFTGDLEKGGEASLVENNSLPQCVLYKAGHHGSKTSSHNAMLDVIKPQIVCVCCCAGTDEYTPIAENMFPTQEFVDRIAPYTDRVYVTTLGTADKGFTSMNGNIVFGCSYVEKQSASDGEEQKEQPKEYEYKFNMYFTANDTKLKDTDWFKNNRTTPDAWKGKEEAAQ